ncbi:LacI family DNA-binding transcriptional regulator [Sphingomonas abietis]|uniref:LacI family DNA-binding transcriptional regulator n=1 Tax=Sphingomonas abietis TaxID=3012344 RepID=A0ABY7NIB4_9SPHN|nr:LacI family DNA-binding transcriptional regulator [Sphingomonas abietis]WBO21017.1 LacI family DNA-binding transcriptional regulator [Sphingomonas abietis]
MTTTRRSSRKQGTAPTIADVARIAGVSPMTVSRVINGETNVRDATREAVNAAISELDYAPNPAARSLAGANQIRIGLLYSNPSAAYLSEFLVGGLEQASRADVQLVIHKCDVDGHEVEAARHLVASGVDGVILPPPLCDAADVIAVLAAAATPVVVVASGAPAERVSAVSIDDHRAAFEMARHIAGLGHRRIGFIVGNPNQTASAQRLNGFRDALAQAGLAADEALIRQGLFTYRSGLEAAEALLDLADAPTAIFASNDDMAAAVVAVAHRRGLDVPRDLTVCGFDDTALATTIWPELTTIHQPIADMSREAVDLLVREIRSKRNRRVEDRRHLVLDHALVRRQSDGAPRG